MRYHILGALGAWTLLLAGCQNSQLKTEVADVAAKMSANLVAVREAAQSFAAAAQNLYSHLDRVDLSTKGMDVRDGGVFDTFQNNTYYFKTLRKGASYYVSPMKPVDDTVRRAVRAMQHLEGDIQSSYEKNGDVMALAFFGVHEPMSVGMLYPWVDVISFLPPALQIRQMEWYQRGLASSGSARWSNGPFVSFYSGWIEDVAVPVLVDNQVRGVIVLATSLEKFKAKYFAGQPENLLLLGSDLTVFVANDAARKALPIKVVEDFDYTKQLKVNSSPSEGYHLSDDTQPSGLKALADAVTKGETQITETVAGKRWTFYVSLIKEPRFYVVGFGPE